MFSPNPSLQSKMSAFTPFQVHKRRRSSSSNIDISEPDWKRRTISLPLRSPARQRPITIATSNPTFNTFGHFLIPDSSENEFLNKENEESRLPSLTASQSSSNASDSSTTVKLDPEMVVSSPMRPPLMGRARSNDILSSPRRRLHVLPLEPQQTTRDRIPTPITSHFDHRLVEMPNAPRHSFPPLRTNLSPMVEQENWSSMGPDGLPSPTEEYVPQIHDPDAMMVYDQTSDDTNGLRVDDAMETEPMVALGDAMQYGLGLDGHLSQGNSTVSGHSRQTSQTGRTARLHMGYLGGCEKCAQKVPGHYSHILWS